MRRRWVPLALPGLLVLAALVATGEETPSERIFRQRILPILRSPDASSCTECHLAAVDLKDYLRPTADETFLSLRDQGLVDLKQPQASRILVMIRMAPAQPNPLVSQRRAEEATAFEDWILASAARPELAGAPALEASHRAAPRRPEEVIRHARSDQLLARFEDQVWRDVERCASCHRSPENAKQVAKFGERVSWIKPGDARATMEGWLEKKLIDLDAPEKSLVLKKPTAQVEHGGGQKLLIGDQTYTRWLAWIRDYTRARKDGYAKPEDLPTPFAEVAIPSDCWVRIETPAKFDGAAVGIAVFPWDGERGAWATERIASASRHAEKGWQQMLDLHAPTGSERAKDLEQRRTLPTGRYLVRVYADTRYDPKKGAPARFGEKQQVGEIEVTRDWPLGYGSMNKLGELPAR